MRLSFPGAALMLLTTVPLGFGDEKKSEKVEYLRPAGKEFVRECIFTIRRGDAGWNIESVTGRGDTRLTVIATYDQQEQLTAAQATLTKGDQKSNVIVEINSGKAKVKREGQDAQEFEVPKGVIVTSAPDWTDTFLLCRRYDRKAQGKQSFPGLWISPTQKAQLLTFTIERKGSDAIQHEGKKLELDRFTIRIRGNSEYTAWADAKGTMVRLIPMPFKEGSVTGLLLHGYEKSAVGLKPPAE